MRLVSLKIYKKKNGEIIRDVRFNERGLSLICDLEGEENKAHGSSIGKTAFTRCIDLCLGAKTTSVLYKSKTLGTNQTFRDYLFDNQVSLILTCQDNEKTITLERHVYDNKEYVNDVEFSDLDSYWQKLKDLFFPNSPSTLSFRRMIPLFVRIDNEEPIKYLEFSKNQQYNEAYSYFLNLYWNEKEASLNEELSANSSAIGKIESKYGIKNDDEFRKLVDTKNEIQQTKKQAIRETDYVGSYVSKDERNAILVDNLDEITEELNAKKCKSRQLSRVIEIENGKLFEMDEEILKNLYSDAVETFKNLNESFTELCAFHNDMCNIRIAKYVDEKNEIDEEIKKLEVKVQQSRKRFSDGFVEFKTSVDDKENSLFEDYYMSKKEYEEAKADFEQYISLEKRNFEIKTSLSNIQSKKKTNEENQKQFSSIFAEQTKKLVNDPYKVIYETKLDKMPFTIQGSDGNLGTGDSKVMSYAIVSSLLTFFAQKSMNMPSFIIQDKMEGVELAKIVKIINDVRNSEIQYIVPILNDRIENLDIKEEEIILKLSKKEKLFKF